MLTLGIIAFSLVALSASALSFLVPTWAATLIFLVGIVGASIGGSALAR